ncbi:uncharacterized protein EKO05_0000757 [Ascochyta rabiei]|uniref:uncharacterized protein n=1 Tax=Didymella rabiei TaxID=5454 RepID=UPI002208A8E9|nr:uncharacterized protein EKO05_0000757 [Ascochyta rabiei]UPX10085.1 hypothetical protein EKO05_0000757 [Ascochyta rabiei]
MFPDVVVFKDTLNRNLVDLSIEQRHFVDVITVTAPCRPKLTDDEKGFAAELDLQDLREKILLILRLAAVNSVTNLVLGAMGCGAYRCLPRAAACEMKTALEKEEFSGWFETTSFAVYVAGSSGKHNFDIFKVFDNP